MFDAWFDTERGDRCRWELAQDGGYLCQVRYAEASGSVRGVLEVVDVEGGYGVAVVRGEDGSFQRMGAYDVTAGVRVKLTKTGRIWWEPVHRVSGEVKFFRDSACTEGVVESIPDYPVEAIGDHRGYLLLGEPISPELDFYKLGSPGTCEAFRLPTSYSYLDLRPVTGLLPAKPGRVELVGGGRIREPWEATVDGRLVARAGALVDTEREVDCVPVNGRCVPPPPLGSAGEGGIDDMGYVRAIALEGTSPPD